ncbi:hypothetical protein M422DRAFT_30372 [Sphaerobolus stellatus SS14]|uniref:Uncharacterized protein n=1 Tax=Sphaerobolus stellatus (strain SS14) TaxID=990650 RepID=A0A0C9VZN8_SPHS4|nr:hypothetical protein M422DRAFT_30372 [Sphaerobolus stellatus SS14]
MSSSGASDELSELLRVAGDDMIIAYRNKSSSPVRESSLRKRLRSASIESIESFIGDQRSTGSHINNGAPLSMAAIIKNAVRFFM